MKSFTLNKIGRSLVLLLISILVTFNINAQTVTIVKDQVLQNKKVISKIVKIGSGADLGFEIQNMNDENLVTITQITEKAKNGATQYMVHFANGKMGVAPNTAIAKPVLLNNLYKNKAIVDGQLQDAGVEKFYKLFLKEFVEPVNTKKEDGKSKLLDVLGDSNEDTIILIRPIKAKAQANVAPLKEVVKAEAIVAPIGLIEDRDISEPVIIKGKLLYQDNFMIGAFATKDEILKGNKVKKVQFKNHKGKFIAEVAYIPGEITGRLYNAITKERTDIDIMDAAKTEEIILDLANQLLDLELL
jgi:hypothetical protein